ncbi:MAG TPA: HAD hydrolase-like protein [Chryseolinea sp.]|nr:HAD hydrolase-like protein [Chryseolinea sp.]HPH45910.1 HAD hydrolase-like protein [Chryseolinea sp.]HPM31954.1 HAD hydrolase-like protein [Chryseolinea sp.]
MKPIELVVFDLAGTTVKDSKDVHRVLQRALAGFDVFISIEDANAVMGIPKPVAIRALLEQRYQGSLQITENWISEIHEAFVESMISFYKNDHGVGEKIGVSETFRKLKENKIKVVVDTGFDRQIVNPLLARLGWLENNLIDASVTSDEVAKGRPHPDLIFKAMQLTGVSDASCVAKVGDTVSDLQEGNAAECGLVIGVTTGAFSEEELQKEKHTHLIKEVSSLLEILGIN